jgi:hypothetical protein
MRANIIMGILMVATIITLITFSIIAFDMKGICERAAYNCTYPSGDTPLRGEIDALIRNLSRTS